MQSCTLLERWQINLMTMIKRDACSYIIASVVVAVITWLVILWLCRARAIFPHEMVKYFLQDDVASVYCLFASSSDFEDASIASTFAAARTVRINKVTLSWAKHNTTEYVLSSFEDINGYRPSSWRRVLWREVYPRAHKSSGAINAADEIIAYVATRICVRPDVNQSGNYSILEIWERRHTDRLGLQLVSAAALRSVGIPTRLLPDGTLIFFARGQWRPAIDFSKLYMAMRIE